MLVQPWLLRAHSDRPAVNDLTYADLRDRALRVRLDAAPGDRVAIALPPGNDFAVALHATWLRGAIAVPHDLRLTPGERPPADVVLEGELAYDREPITPVGAFDLDAVAVGLQTSGSTGAPKPVDLTFGNFLWSALGSAALLGARPEDSWLSALPMSHVGGLSILVRSAIYGTHARVLERWDTEQVLRAIRSESITLVSVVPTTLQRLLDAGLDDRHHLRWLLTGGAPIPPAQLRTSLPVAPTYGLTEATSQVTTFGVPLFCTKVDLAADGEIVVSGPTVVGGGGPLHTGDLGAWDDHGRLHVVGRKSDTIVSGGENVAPAEVEGVLAEHPAVAEAAVFGREHPAWGEAVVAAVVLRPGRHATDDELRRFCAARLAGFKVPKDIAFTTVLPRTGSGKLRRAALR
jgi:O-succinylbenzoic acid--CoA ligase